MGFGTPIVPETITVHLGAPRANARRVTVPFKDYIKNVMCKKHQTAPKRPIYKVLYHLSIANASKIFGLRSPPSHRKGQRYKNPYLPNYRRT